MEVQCKALGKHGRVEHLHRVPASNSDVLVSGAINPLHLLQVGSGSGLHGPWCKQGSSQSIVQGVHSAVGCLLSLEEEAGRFGLRLWAALLGWTLVLLVGGGVFGNPAAARASQCATFVLLLWRLFGSLFFSVLLPIGPLHVCQLHLVMSGAFCWSDDCLPEVLQRLLVGPAASGQLLLQRH